MGNNSAERRPGFCFCKITPCACPVTEAATGLLGRLLCNFSKLKTVLGEFQQQQLKSGNRLFTYKLTYREFLVKEDAVLKGLHCTGNAMVK